jgi:tRNA 2-(methylsulfanyl)-N6-isopentenyladenosine37 hydroxylase
VNPSVLDKADVLPVHSRTPPEWAQAALAEPIALLIDHAFLEKKAAQNAIELLTRWPGEWMPGWIETMTGVARDEAAHLSQVTRILTRRGGRLGRGHRNPYAKTLRTLVRLGGQEEALDRVLVSALIEVRSCERFGVLARVAGTDGGDAELAALYKALFSSEMGHYKVFLRLAQKIVGRSKANARWEQLLAEEANILAVQEPGPRMHSGANGAWSGPDRHADAVPCT